MNPEDDPTAKDHLVEQTSNGPDINVLEAGLTPSQDPNVIIESDVDEGPEVTS